VVLDELVKMRPRDLSFWIASVFNENRMQQQALLQVREPAGLHEHML